MKLKANIHVFLNTVFPIIIFVLVMILTITEVLSYLHHK